jgi:formate dehydrogenase major subunit
MSRFLSHLAELQPELFAEMSPELARELKIDNGDYISVVSLRGAIEARALVSRRIRPMHLNGKTVHQIAMPFHFGSAGPVRGDATNDLVPMSGEPNVTIMEAKALACNIVPGPIASRTHVRGVAQKIRAGGWPAEFASRATAARESSTRQRN